jgi:hypothetical protein
MTNRRKCIICGLRPVSKGQYCSTCTAKIEAERRAHAEQKPKRYLTYRGHVVGLYPNGKGTLTARLLKRDPESLPKRLTLDLNTYLEGFSREQIKAFKRAVLSLAGA